MQDLFNKAELEVEREPLLETDKRAPPAKKRPPSKEHRHENMANPVSPGSVGNQSSASLAPATPPGNLPPPSPSLLGPVGGITSAGGKASPPPPPPARSAGPSASPPPPPPPPPGPKR